MRRSIVLFCPTRSAQQRFLKRAQAVQIRQQTTDAAACVQAVCRYDWTRGHVAVLNVLLRPPYETSRAHYDIHAELQLELASCLHLLPISQGNAQAILVQKAQEVRVAHTAPATTTVCASTSNAVLLFVQLVKHQRHLPSFQRHLPPL